MIVQPSKAPPFLFDENKSTSRPFFFCVLFREQIDTDFEKSIRIGGPGMLWEKIEFLCDLFASGRYTRLDSERLFNLITYQNPPLSCLQDISFLIHSKLVYEFKESRITDTIVSFLEEKSEKDFTCYEGIRVISLFQRVSSVPSNTVTS